ncbi:MAG TPA: hypothetical protein DC054_03610 [Blastocatellia bacterium]|nr:hypothetical protein [Blastocatellia bacterium]
MTSRAQIIDACVLINLVATEELEAILEVTTKPSLICTVVEKETIYLRTRDPQNPKELIDLSDLIGRRILEVCKIENEREELLYVDFAAVLDDGEAMSLAIAVARDLDLVTDEQKARKLFLREVGHPRRLVSTSQLLRKWATASGLTSERIRAALLKIETRARYRPPIADPDYRWWMDSCH